MSRIDSKVALWIAWTTDMVLEETMTAVPLITPEIGFQGI